MLNRAELKAASKEQLKGKWGAAVAATFVLFLLMLPFSIFAGLIPKSSPAQPIISIASLLLAGPIEFGLVFFYIIIVKSKESAEIKHVFEGFVHLGKAIGMFFWRALFIFLWALLLIVPGIIKALAYSQCFYILAVNPNVGIRDAMKISIRMTEGHKWQIFVLGLSFLGWVLLAVLTLGIGFLWLGPYIQTTMCNLYFKLKEDSIQSGRCSREEFEVGKAILG